MTREELNKLIMQACERTWNEKTCKEIEQALSQEPCTDAVSRDAVEDKLLKLCNELEGVFANIRMQNQDESVCGLCEYDCPAPYECPGFDIEDCFKLADEIRHKWQSTKDIPSVTQKPNFCASCKHNTDNEICLECEYDGITRGMTRYESVTHKSGKWIDEGWYAEGHSEHAYRCSECDEHYIGYVGEYNYCPNCGARMVNPQESE